MRILQTPKRMNTNLNQSIAECKSEKILILLSYSSFNIPIRQTFSTPLSPVSVCVQQVVSLVYNSLPPDYYVLT